MSSVLAHVSPPANQNTPRRVRAAIGRIAAALAERLPAPPAKAPTGQAFAPVDLGPVAPIGVCPDEGVERRQFGLRLTPPVAKTRPALRWCGAAFSVDGYRINTTTGKLTSAAVLRELLDAIAADACVDPDLLDDDGHGNVALGGVLLARYVVDSYWDAPFVPRPPFARCMAKGRL